ncbi:MAG: erythromycin esterase family protein [Burkholderiaceae bacterium]|jgi:erythromycin esterase-like protein|nr:erythromycin esterase family protein [Burkholderiaceae bacterium]
MTPTLERRRAERARENRLREALRAHSREIGEHAADDEKLMALLASRRFALLGEASHGTREFYEQRAELTKRLIVDHGLDAVAVEADWPDAQRVNRYVRGSSHDRSAEEALGGFRRFPHWMWRNTIVRDFIGWLRQWNDAQPPDRRVGFYGLDLYSLSASIDAVLAYLDSVDPEAAKRARARYGCFDHFREDAQVYGYSVAFDLKRDCEQAVVQQLVELRERSIEAIEREGAESDALFDAEQNARLVRNAEEYYRAMFGRRVSSWNLRDRHMVDTLQALDTHLAQQLGREPRIALWAHNSHLGDAGATEMGADGQWNVGQLARERYGAHRCTLVGFTTFQGSVTAASEWGGTEQRKSVRPGLAGSFEALFHEAGPERFVLHPNEPRFAKAFAEPMLERAIGVIYLPESERMSHYFHARLPAQFDAVLHFDVTRALEPLDPGARWRMDEVPETYPSGV